MHPPRIRRRSAIIAAAAVLGLGAFSAVAVALTTSAGGPQLRMDNRAQTAATVGGPGAWTTLPGSVVPGLNVPAGEPTRLINARFTAESNCYGPNQGYCMVRIIAVDVNNVMTPLEPASDTDFHFDSDEPGATVASYYYGDEAHAMERSVELKPGNYRLMVQYMVTPGSGTLFRLDDWHFAVEMSA